MAYYYTLNVNLPTDTGITILMNILIRNKQARPGFSLVELVLVLFVITTMLGVITISVISVVSRSKYDADAARLVYFLQRSVHQAVLQQQKLELEIDLDSGTYSSTIVYDEVDELLAGGETEDPNNPAPAVASTAEEAESISGDPLELYYITSIQLEDDTAMGGVMSLYATGGGWMESFIIELTDESETFSRWIRCDRGTTNVRLYKTPAALPKPTSNL